jgi:hypothetical protein
VEPQAKCCLQTTLKTLLTSPLHRRLSSSHSQQSIRTARTPFLTFLIPLRSALREHQRSMRPLRQCLSLSAWVACYWLSMVAVSVPKFSLLPKLEQKNPFLRKIAAPGAAIFLYAQQSWTIQFAEPSARSEPRPDHTTGKGIRMSSLPTSTSQSCPAGGRSRGVYSTVGAWSLWVKLPITLFVGDIWAYWDHRDFHTFPVLWRFHAIFSGPC